jgi:hypothetical protein
MKLVFYCGIIIFSCAFAQIITNQGRSDRWNFKSTNYFSPETTVPISNSLIAPHHHASKIEHVDRFYSQQGSNNFNIRRSPIKIRTFNAYGSQNIGTKILSTLLNQTNEELSNFEKKNIDKINRGTVTSSESKSSEWESQEEGIKFFFL